MNHSSLKHGASSLSTSLFRILLFTLVLGFCTQFVSAQSDLTEYPTASLSAAGIISIPSDSPLAETYLFDLSHLEFEDGADMVAFLSDKSGENYIVRAIPNRNMGVLVLKCSKNPAWSCSDWNAHLNVALTQKPIVK